MTIQEKFAELERLMSDQGRGLQLKPLEDERLPSQMIFIVTDNSSSPKADFSSYAKLA